MYRRCYAKINLGLNVKGRREDGYHELEMIMLPINFYDELYVEKSLYMHFESNRTYVSTNKNNTVLAAVSYLKERYGFLDNFTIRLNKHIPTRAGLAGGSSDGANMILAIDELLGLNMSDAEKKEACLALGSDVYFCLLNRPSLVKGTGDVVLPFEMKMDPYILLVKPKEGVSTKESFRTLDLLKCDHPDINKIKEDLENNDYDALIKDIGNSLEEPSFRLNPKIKTIKEELVELGMDVALMSGSGSTVFALSLDEKKIDEVQAIMYKKGYFVRKTKIFNNAYPLKAL